MSATATLNARVDVADKERFAATASALGISPSAAVNVFVRKFNEVGGGSPSTCGSPPSPSSPRRRPAISPMPRQGM